MSSLTDQFNDCYKNYGFEQVHVKAAIHMDTLCEASYSKFFPTHQPCALYWLICTNVEGEFSRAFHRFFMSAPPNVNSIGIISGPEMNKFNTLQSLYHDAGHVISISLRRSRSI